MIERALQYLDKLNLEPMRSSVISDGACHLRDGLRCKRHVFFIAFALLCVGRSGFFVALFLANLGGFFD